MLSGVGGTAEPRETRDKGPWSVAVYADDKHVLREVTRQMRDALGVSWETAEQLAKEADEKVSSSVELADRRGVRPSSHRQTRLWPFTPRPCSNKSTSGWLFASRLTSLEKRSQELSSPGLRTCVAHASEAIMMCSRGYSPTRSMGHA